MKLTKKQQLAVDIAKDVLKQLDARKLRIRRGTYCSGSIDSQKGGEIKVGDQVQEHLPVVRKACDVCAKGALFLSYVELKNKVRFEHINVAMDLSGYEGQTNLWFGHGYMCDLLGGAFDRENLNLIENAFEVDYSPQKLTSPALEFGRKHKTPAARMRAICQNIIDNDGVFKP